MTIQMLRTWNGYEQFGVYTLSGAEETRLITAGLAQSYVAPSRVPGDGNAIPPNALAPITAALDFAQSVTIAVAGDSTGNASDEWVYGLTQWLMAQAPNHRVEYRVWNTGTVGYDATQVLQTGDLAPRVVFADTFASGSGELFGRTPETGPAWSYDGASALGDWTVGSGKITRTSDPTVSTALAPYDGQGDAKLTLTGVNFSTIGDGTATRIFTIYLHYIDASNLLYCDVRVAANGSISGNVFKRVAATTTNIGTYSAPAQIPGSTASVTVDLEIERVGTAVTMRANGATLVAATPLTGGDVTVFNAGNRAGFAGGLGNLIGMTIDGVSVTATTTADTVPRISIYNGSAPGQTLAYQVTNFAAMYPVAPDVVYVSSCHNYGGTSAADYYTAVRNFCETTMRGTYASARFVICSQNPKKLPAVGVESHLTRMAQLRILAADRGFSYLPVAEGFRATAGWEALIQSDGVHPTVGLSGLTGSSLWRDIATNQIASVRM